MLFRSTHETNPKKNTDSITYYHGSNIEKLDPNKKSPLFISQNPYYANTYGNHLFKIEVPKKWFENKRSFTSLLSSETYPIEFNLPFFKRFLPEGQLGKLQPENYKLLSPDEKKEIFKHASKFRDHVEYKERPKDPEASEMRLKLLISSLIAMLGVASTSKIGKDSKN